MTPSARPHRETRAFYDKLSSVYDLMAQHSEGPIKELAARKLRVQTGERILEIGCGTGRVLVPLAASAGPAGIVVGLDLSEGMLSVSREFAANPDAAAPVRLVCASALELPLQNAAFDAIFMSFTLELFDPAEVSTVLAECRRVLKPDGRMAVASVSSEGPHGLRFEIYEWTHRHFPNLVDCRPLELCKLLESAGFRVSDRTVTDMWVPVEIAVAEAAA